MLHYDITGLEPQNTTSDNPFGQEVQFGMFAQQPHSPKARASVNIAPEFRDEFFD
jgi:hypothetical protein